MKREKTRLISFLDTTLRDGEQAPKNGLTSEQKLKMAYILEDMGVNKIETGFPAASKEDFDATVSISKNIRSPMIATFSRTRIDDIRASIDAVYDNDRHMLMLVATGSDLHLKHKRNITRQQGLDEIQAAIEYAKDMGLKNISLGIEDASRSDYRYISEIMKTSITAGANQIILADTTGYATPDEFGNLIKFCKMLSDDSVSISTHCHNDLGLGLANTIAGIHAGADEVQVTLGGIGERAGNTSLEQLAAYIYYKCKGELTTTINLDKIPEAFKELCECIGVRASRNIPILGEFSFATAAGIHQQGILNNPDVYEFVKPNEFNLERKFFISRHSGRSIIKFLYDDLGINPSEKDIDDIYQNYIYQGNNTYETHELKNIIKERLSLNQHY